MESEKIIFQNLSERTFRWPDLEIAAGDTVEIYKEQMEHIPVLKKLIQAGELEVVGGQNSPKPQKTQEKATESHEDDDEEEIKKVVNKLKGKK